MGCGASAARGQAVTSLAPGELRDLSQQNTVVLYHGVAAAGQRTSQPSCKGAPLEEAGLETEQVLSGGQEALLGKQQESPLLPEVQVLKASSEGADLSQPELQSDDTPLPNPGQDPDRPPTPDREPSTARISEPQLQQLEPPPEPSLPEDQDTLPPAQASPAAEAPLPTSRPASATSPSSPPPEPAEMWGPKPPAGAEPGAGVAPYRRRSSGSNATPSSTTTTTTTTTSITSNSQTKTGPQKTLTPPKAPAQKPAHGLAQPGKATAVKQPAAVAAKPPQPGAKQPQPAQRAHQQQQQQQQPRMVDCAVSLQFLIEFCATVPEDMPTWKVVTDVIVPATRARQCRYVEMVEPRHVGHCDYFISHRWATPFSHLVRYVRKHLVELGDVVEEVDAGGGDGTAASAPPGTVITKAASRGAEYDEDEGPKRSADKVFVWCDIFAINQHPGQVQADDLAQLKDCVEASHQTLLCLDNKGLVLTRIWCLYEIWNTVLTGDASKLAVLGYDLDPDSFKEVYITLDVEEAQATVEADRMRILADIEAATGLQELNMAIKGGLVESTQAEAENALKVLLPQAKIWKDYERVITAVNKHMQMLMTVGQHGEAQRYGYVIQTVSQAWQKSQAAQDLARGGAKRTSGPGTAASTFGASGASGVVSTGGAGVVIPRGAGVVVPRGAGVVIIRGVVSTREGVVPPDAPAPAAAGTGPDSTAAAAAAADSGAAAVPSWHCSSYPRDGRFRKMLERAALAEKHGHYDNSLALLRDAVSQAEKRFKSATGSTAKSAAALDLAGCRIQMAAVLAARGFLDQAVEEAGEPAVAAFQEHCGKGSLPFASAALQVAQAAKNNWNKKDLRTKLLDSALSIFESKLGHTHAATLEALEEKAELTFNNGDFPGGVDLLHKLAVRVSDGTDLAARPSSAAAAAAAAATSAIQEFSPKALEVWMKLLAYMNSSPGREDDCIRICRGLIPQKRRDHLRRLRDVAADPTSEYAAAAASELRKLGLGRVVTSRPSSTASSASAAGRGGTGGTGAGGSGLAAVDLEPDGLADPDDPRVDVVGHSAELQYWSTMLAKQGKMTEAVLLQWRLAETFRADKNMATMETQLPSGKVTMVEAYERCLMLDMSVPGIAKVAAKMLAERDGTAAAARGDGGGGGAAVGGATGSAGKPVYDGPGYMELIQEMSKLWGELNYKGAERVVRQLVECQTAAHGSISTEVVDAKSQLARLLQCDGRLDEAVAEMREALQLHEQIRHGKDPAMAHTLHTLADMLAETDRAEAEKLYVRAVNLLKKVYGPHHYETAQAVTQLAGFIMGDCGRMEEGQKMMEEGMAYLKRFQEQQLAAPRAF